MKTKKRKTFVAVPVKTEGGGGMMGVKTYAAIRDHLLELDVALDHLQLTAAAAVHVLGEGVDGDGHPRLLCGLSWTGPIEPWTPGALLVSRGPWEHTATCEGCRKALAPK